MGTREKKKRSVLWTVLLIICICVCCYAAFRLLSILYSYHEGTVEYTDVARKAGMTDDQMENLLDTENVTLEDLGSVNFDELAAINDDVVAWIRFPNPDVINYPIVASKDNTDYLHLTFEKNQNASGTLFIDMNNAKDFSDENVIIYGHAMKNKSMFGSLKAYEDEAFYKENPYFYIYTRGGGIYRYQIFAAYTTTDTSDTYQIAFADAASFMNYLNWAKEQSIYDTGVALNAESHIVTLSTCTNRTENGRFVVQGVLTETYQQEDPRWPAYPWSTQQSQ